MFSEEKSSTIVELCEYLGNSGGLPDSMSFVKPSQSMEHEEPEREDSDRKSVV